MPSSWSAFLAISILVIVTPGPDTALTIRNTLRGGRNAGIATALGICSGQLGWAILTSLGLAAILLASEPVFDAVRLGGAAYLIYLGAQSLRSALSRGGAAVTDPNAAPGVKVTPGRAFRQGIISNVTNPKMAVFFASVLPQFASQDHDLSMQLPMLGLIFATITFLWLVFYCCAITALGTLLRKPSVRRSLDGVVGITLIALGIRVATATR